MRHNPHLDEVIIAPRTRGVRRIADDLGLARRLRRERFLLKPEVPFHFHNELTESHERDH